MSAMEQHVFKTNNIIDTATIDHYKAAIYSKVLNLQESVLYVPQLITWFEEWSLPSQ